MKIIIIGGVAAGASAAAKARRVNEQAEIVVFERGPYVSFANCGLPYYIGDEIKNRANLFLQTPESFWKRFRVKVQVLHEVVSIDPQNKTVQVKNLSTQQEFSETYGKLILTPGAGAIVPPLPNINAQNIFVVKTVPDSDRVKQYIAENSPKRAVVIGGGFIGLESAEALVHRGIEVTLVELQPQLLPPFDKDMAKFVAAHLQENGIRLVLGNGISGFKEENDKATHVQLDNGEELAIDLAILSIGVRPELKLAKDIGLQIGASGGIVVDDFQQTSNPDVYAAGDAVEVRHLVTQKFTRIPLAGPANKQGRVAGANAAGGNMKFPGALGTSIVESMGIVAAKTGLSEKEATQQGLDYLVSFIHSQDHASYYRSYLS